MEDRVKLLKNLFEKTEVIVRATYGEEEKVNGKSVKLDKSGKIFIDTEICTG